MAGGGRATMVRSAACCLAAALVWAQGAAAYPTAGCVIATDSRATEALVDLAWSANAPVPQLAVASWDGHVYVYAMSNLSVPIRVLTGGGMPSSVAYSPDGSHLAVTHGTGIGATVYSTSNYDYDPVVIPVREARCLAWSPDGAQLAVGSFEGAYVYNTSDLAGGVLSVVNISAQSARLKPNARGAGLGAVEYSPDGKQLALGSADSNVYVYSTSDLTGEPIAVLDTHGTLGEVRAMAYSPDNSQLVVGADGANTYGILVYAPSRLTDKPIALRGMRNYLITKVAFSPDGAELAVASQYYAPVLTVYNVSQLGQDRYPLHEIDTLASVYSVAYSPDGARLAVGTKPPESVPDGPSLSVYTRFCTSEPTPAPPTPAPPTFGPPTLAPPTPAPPTPSPPSPATATPGPPIPAPPTFGPPTLAPPAPAPPPSPSQASSAPIPPLTPAPPTPMPLHPDVAPPTAVPPTRNPQTTVQSPALTSMVSEVLVAAIGGTAMACCVCFAAAAVAWRRTRRTVAARTRDAGFLDESRSDDSVADVELAEEGLRDAGQLGHRAASRSCVGLAGGSRRSLRSCLAPVSPPRRGRAICKGVEADADDGLDDTSQGAVEYSPAWVVEGRVIGQGGFGLVKLGVHSATQELLAVKCLAASDGVAKELGLLEKLRHPRIVELKGFHIAEGQRDAVIYLEYLCGGSLHEAMKQHGRMFEPAVRRCLRDALLGLEYLHSCDVVHRDVKPHNLLLEGGGRVKLADFGCSKEGVEQTECTAVRGTSCYMAPECVAGRVSKGSDLWSFGATLVQLASGRTPWEETGLSGMSLMIHIASGAGQDGHHPVVTKMSPEGVRVALWCFAAESAARPTCAELLQDPFFCAAQTDLPGAEAISDYRDFVNESRSTHASPASAVQVSGSYCEMSRAVDTTSVSLF
eukprot:TRINITY_DN2336_c0_g1_i10.p1 TRINITY_DN2336_c0_g1~~TRINITY_DN2336_c0_g1_i10.p1  ORF type:complete len:917 (+),score=126.43 TRINITY_DN2336_c0_g1_i10:30-2780(+)